jgi:hypothetical protein
MDLADTRVHGTTHERESAKVAPEPATSQREFRRRRLDKFMRIAVHGEIGQA